MSSCTTINAHITDQVLQLSNVPKIASGSRKALIISCTFCGKWAGCANAAVFTREGVGVYHVPVVDGLVTVPHEVLAEEGYFEVGFMGVDDITRTTEIVRVAVAKGAVTTATAVPDPTPDAYEQLMAIFGKVIAMKSATGATVYPITDTRLSGGEIISNGAAAYISFTLRGMTAELAESDYYETGYIIPPAFTPLTQVYLNDNNDLGNISVFIEPLHANEDGWLKIEVTKNDGKSPMNLEVFNGFYDLASISIEELANVRIGYDGVEYPTAGDAVREQVRAAMQAVENGKGVVLDEELDYTSKNPVTNQALTKAFDDVHDHIDRVGLPEIGAEDEGKTAQVVNGQWQVVKPTAMPIDDKLDTDSRNPVQNRVVAQQVQAAQQSLEAMAEAVSQVTEAGASLSAQVNDALQRVNTVSHQMSALQTGLESGEQAIQNLAMRTEDLEARATLPDASTADNGKFLRVMGGKWVATAVPVAEEVAF